MQDRFFFREYVKSGHESQEEHGKCSKRDPNSGEIYADRRGLILVDARSFRRAAGQSECVPDFPAVHVFADGPGDFLVERFAGKDARRMNIIRDHSLFSDANLPGKFAENEIAVGLSSLKMLVALAKVIRRAARAGGKASLDSRELLADADVVPVAIVFAEVAKTLIRIEEQIFLPIVDDFFDLDVAPLEPDNLVVHAAQLAARAKRDERRGCMGSGFELLKDREIWVFGVENRMTAPAYNRLGLPERAERDGRSTLRAIERPRLGLGRPWERRSSYAHHQPSKLRRFFNLRSSNSTNSPRYKAGSASL